MSAYADTSFLFSLYVADANTTKALRLIRAASLPILATPLVEFELENAIYQRQFRRELTSAECKTSIAAFRSDLNAIFDLRPLTAEMLKKAMALSSRRTPDLGTRALDVLHVASALVLEARDFYTFDQAQAKLAKAERLLVRG